MRPSQSHQSVSRREAAAVSTHHDPVHIRPGTQVEQTCRALARLLDRLTHPQELHLIENQSQKQIESIGVDETAQHEREVQVEAIRGVDRPTGSLNRLGLPQDPIQDRFLLIQDRVRPLHHGLPKDPTLQGKINHFLLYHLSITSIELSN